MAMDRCFQLWAVAHNLIQTGWIESGQKIHMIPLRLKEVGSIAPQAQPKFYGLLVGQIDRQFFPLGHVNTNTRSALYKQSITISISGCRRV
jgi:hypothetical protein